jgi:hypothetical protein
VAVIRLYFSLSSGEWTSVSKRSLMKAQRGLEDKLYHVERDGEVRVTESTYQIRAEIGDLVQGELRRIGTIESGQYVLVEPEEV